MIDGASVVIPPSRTVSHYVVHDSSVLQGEPSIVNTEVAVRDIVVLWKSGMKPEEIPARLFNLISIAQVLDALSFYSDLPGDVDRWIDLYADHPEPLSRLNPLWNDVIENINVYRDTVDTESES